MSSLGNILALVEESWVIFSFYFFWFSILKFKELIGQLGSMPLEYHGQRPWSNLNTLLTSKFCQPYNYLKNKPTQIVNKETTNKQTNTQINWSKKRDASSQRDEEVHQAHSKDQIKHHTRSIKPMDPKK